jgi:hypothetical protein
LQLKFDLSPVFYLVVLPSALALMHFHAVSPWIPWIGTEVRTLNIKQCGDGGNSSSDSPLGRQSIPRRPCKRWRQWWGRVWGKGRRKQAWFPGYEEINNIVFCKKWVMIHYSISLESTVQCTVLDPGDSVVNMTIFLLPGSLSIAWIVCVCWFKMLNENEILLRISTP